MLRKLNLYSSLFICLLHIVPNQVLLSGAYMSAGYPLLSDLAQGEYVSAFRQAPRRENALSIINAGMRLLFEEDTDIIKELSIFFGGDVSATVFAKQTCRTLTGRYNFPAFSVSLTEGTLRA